MALTDREKGREGEEQGQDAGRSPECQEATQAEAKLRAFLVRYRGLWLGGQSVVLATDSQSAVELVRNHPDTMKFEKEEAFDIGAVDGPVVLYNHNGDY